MTEISFSTVELVPDDPNLKTDNQEANLDETVNLTSSHTHLEIFETVSSGSETSTVDNLGEIFFGKNG